MSIDDDEKARWAGEREDDAAAKFVESKGWTERRAMENVRPIVLRPYMRLWEGVDGKEMAKQ